MSKEQLEGIKEKREQLLDMMDESGVGEANLQGIYNDLGWLIDRAEQVEELKEQDKHNRDVLTALVGEEIMSEQGYDYKSEMMKLTEQNKRYRELIKKTSQEIEVLTNVMSSADNADELNFEVIRLKEELEESE